MADALKITPITIKPIAIKTMGTKPAVPAPAPATAAAPKPAAPASAPAAAAAPKPAAPTPAPAAAAAPKPAAPAPAPAAGPAIRPIVIAPPAAGKPLSADSNTATIRLSPASKPAAPAPAPAAPAPKPIALKPAVSPAAAPALAADESAPTVVIKPIAVKPKIVAPAPSAAPPAPATPQSAKSTTSRISLDSALSQPPAQGDKPAAMGKLTSNLTQAAVDAAKNRTAKVSLAMSDADDASRQQTIRVKAPASAPVAPAQADAPAAPMPADASEAPTVRKKSLVLKKPVGPAAGTAATLKLKADPAASKPADEGEKKESIAEGSGPGGGLDDIETPPSAMSQGGALALGPVKVKKTHWVFPLAALLDIAAIVTVIVYFMAQTCGPDRSLTDYTTFKGMFDSPFALGGSVLVK